ncbi:S-methyl-5'-thioadenosine phosphorylase [Commensalibacter papalotli (ex Servin-Garciduenas et al. 2014)]|uniref:S-methyl-5'-thioadenosine phosphorylase n=1 Tax=Commensalibacter papalotli (ex Servin-Garciduenas et al. 2014) TaxID=1208583 RepID=W7E1R3_9PROT|nr:S-methyl-5'-thioadenosine phosphorylase [Commensalibacter papalotli (ex Servin-Garciduenas et al. 2014)]EUK19029.1 5'-methylthioadenosine phosphorylase [Commensalibacter papalotli (ex Servin-Garciduenas et al. 2014)]
MSNKQTHAQPVIGIIGGSGLYDISGLTDQQWVKVETPWGDPSDELLMGKLEGVSCVFLPRHGRGHVISPTEVNYKANIAAMKKLGVTDIVSVSAVGSLKEELAPGTFVVVDQVIDRTRLRDKSFFGTGCVAHVSLADPFCDRIGQILFDNAKELGLSVVKGGTYLVMEGPQFSTRAESNLYRSWGASVIGMTNMPEAALAREAEICYATVAMVTDYDCWHEDHDAVSVEAVIKTLTANASNARSLVEKIIPSLGKQRPDCSAGCDHALEYALMTAPQKRDPKLVEDLKTIAGRVL